MDQICRLCLTPSENMSCKLDEETKILDHLSCLNIQVLINESLPSHVCYLCSKTLDDVINYRENILQNQYKLIEQLNTGKKFDDLHQSIKTEIDTEDIDQSVHYDSEPINDTIKKINKEDDKAMKFDKENHETVYFDAVKSIGYRNTNKTSQKEETPKKLTREMNTHGNDISNNIKKTKRKIKKKLERQMKKAKKKNTSKATVNSIETKTELEVLTKVENNITDDNSTNLETMNYNDTEFENLENETDIVIKNHKCLTCFNYLPSNSELIRHYKSKYNNNVEKENETDEIEGKIIDKVMSDKAERPYNCKICGRTFTCVYSIIRHARAHSDHSLSCSHGCGYSTVYRGALADHERRHEKDFKYKCETCGAGFHVKTWYNQHQNIHNNVKPFVCDFCGMAFHMSRYLTSHRSTIHAEFIKGVKRYICPHCDLAFDNTLIFRTHLEEHRGKKKYLCALCGKEYSSREQLKYHNNSHLGVKPFVCSICNKRFTKKFNLSVHQRAHAGEKHLCQECGKPFAQRSTLLRHTRKYHPKSKECKNESESLSEAINK